MKMIEGLILIILFALLVLPAIATPNNTPTVTVAISGVTSTMTVGSTFTVTVTITGGDFNGGLGVTLRGPGSLIFLPQIPLSTLAPGTYSYQFTLTQNDVQQLKLNANDPLVITAGSAGYFTPGTPVGSNGATADTIFTVTAPGPAFSQLASAFDANYTSFNPASSFSWANATAIVDPFGAKGNFTSTGSIATTSAFNQHDDPFVNATEASFSISATDNKAFNIQTPSVGSLLLAGTNAANNAAFAETSGKSYAQGTFRAIDFSAGFSNTQATDTGALSVANAFSTSNADWSK